MTCLLCLTEVALSELGQRAAQIEELCEFLAAALEGDPVTARAGTAVGGLGTLAAGLARDLFDLARPDD